MKHQLKSTIKTWMVTHSRLAWKRLQWLAAQVA